MLLLPMTLRRRLTLNQVFLLTLLGLMLFLGLLFFVFYYGTSQSILESSNRLRHEVGLRLENEVVSFHTQARAVAHQVETDMQEGLIHIYDERSLESALYEQVRDHPDIAEVSFTHSDADESRGEIRIKPTNHWQVSVFRAADLNQINRRRVWREGENVIVRLADATGVHIQSYSPRQVPDSDQTHPFDPTTHPTFTGPLEFVRPIWTDLHISELSAERIRIEVTVMQVVRGGANGFLGVVRVGLLESQLDKIVAGVANESQSSIHHTCFICDSQGRLITKVADGDYVPTDAEDLRIKSPNEPPEIAAALRTLTEPGSAIAADLAASDEGGGEITAGGRRYLVTFLHLPRDTQDWVLGVLAPEDEYLGGLIRTRDLLLKMAGVVILVILIGGALTLRAVQRGLSRLSNVASRMRKLDFAPSDTIAPFRDVQRVMDSLEQAKTALRSMRKYVPMDLVSQLYEMNREPVLGGELRELSILFTDIAGFTSLSESLDPDRLASALGQYLEVMTNAIHEHAGTIDKYIGDSVMALWNAPRLCESHPIKACAAALACTTATRKLFASPTWQGLPPWRTRCGLHVDRVNVGHFGSPDRLNYTALGDGVNLASRLEGLNKIYGTSIIVSETIQKEATAAFCLRLLDRVAVFGKRKAVKIYELRESPNDAAMAYETALAAYWAREFSDAIRILEKQLDDPPSSFLAERCRSLLADPPAAEWDGVYAPMMK
jgi:adenylate cyclase